MMSPSAKPSGSTNTTAAQGEQAGTGHFMLTLCRLAAPVSIRPPQSPRLKRFTFFMSRAPKPDGGEQFSLHMGYFATLADAERWLTAVRRSYPDAFATIRPAESMRPANFERPALPRAASEPLVAQSTDRAALMDEYLSDTQVLRILETRGAAAVPGEVDRSNCDQIALLRPDDTGTRRALKEAVAQGATVSFAVQLHWSTQPIDMSGVPSLAIFKPHTLYATESHREGRSCYFLRLGFFADPISAKQVAVQLRSTFASAAVVPVVEQEITRARETGMGAAAIPYFGEQRVDRGIIGNGTSGFSTQSIPSSEAPRRLARAAEAAAPKSEPPARKGTFNDTDTLSESGVRHLRVEVLEETSGRWRIVRLGGTPSDTVHVRS
jgi:hypothetical protein